jgi:hypothetical protein
VANLAVPIPRTFGPGETEVASYLNAGVRDAVNFLTGPPIAQLVQATVQSVPNAAVAVVLFDSSVTDSYGGHSNTLNNTRYTAQVSGWYFVSGIVGFAANSTGVRVARLAKNGTAVIYFDAWSAAVVTNNATSAGTSGILFLAAGDYVELDCFQTSGGALSTILIGPQSGMSVYWLHV